MSHYASDTSVSADASRAEIERTLRRYGATGFMYGWEGTRAVIGFVINGWQVRYVLPLPDPSERRFTHTPTRGTLRTPTAAQGEWEQACRQSWRALALVIKAQLEAVEAGITTVEEAFLAHTVTPGGETVADRMLPVMQAWVVDGVVPKLMLEARR